jgi:outer membrane protein OmpA-like peptidoglycan-associated protein
MRRATTALIAGALATAALAACGGSDGNELSTADYKKATDKACAGFSKDAEAVFKDADFTKDSVVTDAAKKYADVVHGAADKLRDIGYPKGKKDAANEYYDQLDKAADKLESDPKILKADEAPAEFKRINALSKTLGLERCGD